MLSPGACPAWIERTHHRRRRQADLGRLTPIEYGMINTPNGRPGRLTQPVTGPRGQSHRERFQREVSHAVVVEVDANHLTINTHAETAAAVGTSSPGP